MPNLPRRIALAVVAASLLAASVSVVAQRVTGLTSDQTAQRWRAEQDLQYVAVVERKVMMAMRDGVRLATDVYRPKNAAGKVPTIFVRTPYDFNYWDVQSPAG